MWLNHRLWKICLSKWESSPRLGVKIKHIWNHHLFLGHCLILFVLWLGLFAYSLQQKCVTKIKDPMPSGRSGATCGVEPKPKCCKKRTSTAGLLCKTWIKLMEKKSLIISIRNPHHNINPTPHHEFDPSLFHFYPVPVATFEPQPTTPASSEGRLHHGRNPSFGGATVITDAGPRRPSLSTTLPTGFRGSHGGVVLLIFFGGKIWERKQLSWILNGRFRYVS